MKGLLLATLVLFLVESSYSSITSKNCRTVCLKKTAIQTKEEISIVKDVTVLSEVIAFTSLLSHKETLLFRGLHVPKYKAPFIETEGPPPK